MVKTLIFDFDGTIVDSFPFVLEIANKIAHKDKYNIVKDTPELHAKSMCQIIQEIGVPFYKIPSYIKKVKEEYRERIKEVQLVEGIKNNLSTLSKKYQIVLITTNTEEAVKRIVARERIEYIQKIYADTPLFGRVKKIKKLLKDLKHNKEDAVYIGDEIRDIEACRRVGIKIIAVSWGYNHKKALEAANPDGIIDKPEELLKIMNMLRKEK